MRALETETHIGPQKIQPLADFLETTSRLESEYRPMLTADKKMPKPST
jgi:hypothetical protein